MNAAEMLEEFHQAFGDTAARRTLHDEEHDELIEALELDDRLAIAKELADVVYVAYGTARAYALDLDAALAEVHRSNMTKQRLHRADGKVLKGPNYRAPDMRNALA